MAKIGFLNKGQIASKYGVSRKTLNKVIKKHEKEIGEPYGAMYSPAQILKFKEILGSFCDGNCP